MKNVNMTEKLGHSLPRHNIEGAQMKKRTHANIQ